MEIDCTRQEILDSRGHLLIKGGPGCGKTSIALLKAAAEVPTLGANQKVLFLSFSNAAVKEIAARMRDASPADDRHSFEMRTFHSFFMEVVRSHGGLLNGRAPNFIPPDQERLLRARFTGTDDEWRS
jgi:DNA helicase-2/ATP-dependent DNA helicase PcrA